jgi:hypothetical protein
MAPVVMLEPREPTDRLPFPLLDITTTATGHLCWRGFHPLEWQLTSLHQTVLRLPRVRLRPRIQLQIACRIVSLARHYSQTRLSTGVDCGS